MLRALFSRVGRVRHVPRARSHAHAHPLARASLHVLLVGLAALAALLAARLTTAPEPLLDGGALSIPSAPLSGVRTIASGDEALLRPGVSHTTIESPLRAARPFEQDVMRASENVSSESSLSSGIVAAAGSGENGADVRSLADRIDPLEPYVLYTVRPGDTLGVIAERHKTTVDNILLNNAEVHDEHSLPTGLQILVPTGGEGILYKVGHGETLGDIVEDYLNVTVADITAHRPNNLFDDRAVSAGDYILLPGAEPKPPPVVTPGGRPYQDYGVPDVSPGRFGLPLAAWGFISDTFGSYRGPGRIHTGIDLALGTHPGSSIYAACDGQVSRTEWLTYSYGYYVIVDCGGGWETLYSHFSEITVSWGQSVTKGVTILGISGSTGYSTGEHLHFEIRHNSVPLDPEIYLDF